MASHNPVEDLESVGYDQGALQDEKKLDAPPEYDEPFGNEEFAEVKYRTMAWW
jgi:hypothetical protein